MSETLLTVLLGAGASVWLSVNVWAAAPGDSQAAPQPAPRTKAVEEPVFKMPELVIIGDNQARIMAQKEQLAGSPMRGLHEAPLLEKEEGSVAALRKREPAPRFPPVVPGTVPAVKLEGGSPSWLGGSVWIGRQESKSLRELALSGSWLKGEPVGFGNAGGWDTQVTLGYARLLEDEELKAREARLPNWARYLAFLGLPDGESVTVGWQEGSRDLPFQSVTAQRRLSRLFVGGEVSQSEHGYSETGRFELMRVRTPQGPVKGTFAAGNSQLPIWHRGNMALRIKPRGEAEAAGPTGTHLLAGATVEAAWIPSERWRYLAGFSAEGLFGGRVSARSLRPVGGVSWTTPAGPTISASFSPSLRAAWFAEQAVAVPYSLFTTKAGIEPERELADAEISVWQQLWDGSEGRATYRFRESRNALSWLEQPGEGLWQPVVLSELRVHELSLSLRYNGWRPFRVYGEGRWRSITSPAGQVTNLPRGEGKVGAGWDWRVFTVGLELAVARSRPRSVLGPDLEPYEDVRLKLSWKPRAGVEVYGRGENLLGERVEHWGGYPEPKRFLTAGAIISF